VLTDCAQREHFATCCAALAHTPCPACCLSFESLLPLQDDAHIFCLPNQIGPEIGRVLDLTEDIMTAFGFEAEGFEVGTGTAVLCQTCSSCQLEHLNVSNDSVPQRSHTHFVLAVAD
jgi:hypothetical protein